MIITAREGLMDTRVSRIVAPCAVGMALTASAVAHHSYSMFDYSKLLSVSGTVAKHEWKNPHAYIWVYVPSVSQPGKHDLYAFENGSPSVLQQTGWNKDSLRPGDRVTVEYGPLRDGRSGGHCARVLLADGRTLICGGGPLSRPAAPAPGARP
jgi:hypothetical protein